MKRLLAAALAAGLLSACAGVSAPGATKSQTPQQSLTSSGTAMSKLRSARFDVNGTVHVTLPQALVDQLRAKGGAQAGILTSDMTVTLKVSGAAQKPDQLQATISATLGGLTLNTEVIAVGGKLYYKDPMTSKWQLLKREARITESKTGRRLSYQTILDTASSVTDVTDTNSTINGVTVDHYRVVPDLAKLLAAISAGHTTTNSAAMSALQTVLQSATLTADVWTGSSDHLVRRLSYDADFTADLSQLVGALKARSATTKAPVLSLPAGSMVHLTAHITVDLHDFNRQLTIEAPTLAS